ncbi:hypothetical protein IMZ48_22080, partial [Candidatus Bathyarchaeota archaeon]|nr:hypothetical protein [Candidatus Bathyarchaeota archaeon]
PMASVTVIETEEPRIFVTSLARIGRIEFNGIPEPSPTVPVPANRTTYTLKELEERFPPSEPLKLSVLGMNGKSKTIGNVWRLFGNTTFIRVPGTSIVLNKTSMLSKDLEELEDPHEDNDKFWNWATLLTRKDKDGRVEHATAVDSRVGLILDGAYVHFGDTRVNCGPMLEKHNGADAEFGGQFSEEVRIPKGQEVVKVEVSRRDVGYSTDSLRSLRFHLADGTAGGKLWEREEISVLGEFFFWFSSENLFVAKQVLLTMVVSL